MESCTIFFYTKKKTFHVPYQGYLFISVLVNSNSDLIRLINNGIKNDLTSRNPTFMNLALHCIANVGSREMAETFASEIPSILVAGFVYCVYLNVQIFLFRKKSELVLSFIKYNLESSNNNWRAVIPLGHSPSIEWCHHRRENSDSDEMYFSCILHDVLRDTMDSVKQSAALCLLRLYRTSPDLVPMGEWTARVVHLLNDQHLVRLYPFPISVLPAVIGGTLLVAMVP